MEGTAGTAFFISEDSLEVMLRSSVRGGVQCGYVLMRNPYSVFVELTGPGAEDMFASLCAAFGPVLFHRGRVSARHLLFAECRKTSSTVVAAESCTGGMLGELLSEEPGSSDVFWGSFVTYANRAKEMMLGVPARILESAGAVSRDTVHAMAEAALQRSLADVACSISGIAGPGGGSDVKPIGTVWVAVAGRGLGVYSRKFIFPGERSDVRRAACEMAMLMLTALLREGKRLDSWTNWQYSYCQ